MSVKPVTRWGVLWSSESQLDGLIEHLVFDECVPALFTTRAGARAFVKERYAYVRERGDLRKEPHGWRMPKPVRVTVSVAGRTTRGTA